MGFERPGFASGAPNVGDDGLEGGGCLVGLEEFVWFSRGRDCGDEGGFGVVDGGLGEYSGCQRGRREGAGAEEGAVEEGGTGRGSGVASEFGPRIDKMEGPRPSRSVMDGLGPRQTPAALEEGYAVVKKQSFSMTVQNTSKVVRLLMQRSSHLKHDQHTRRIRRPSAGTRQSLIHRDGEKSPKTSTLSSDGPPRTAPFAAVHSILDPAGGSRPSRPRSGRSDQGSRGPLSGSAEKSPASRRAGRSRRGVWDRATRRSRFESHTAPLGVSLLGTTTLVSMTSTMVGVMSLDEAVQMADGSEIVLAILSPGADPPVLRLFDSEDYKKHKFEQQKKKRVQRKRSLANRVDIKEVKMGYNIDSHDYSVRLRAAKRFLSDGDKVKVIVNLKRRENEFKDKAIELLKQFQNDLWEIPGQLSMNISEIPNNKDNGFVIELRKFLGMEVTWILRRKTEVQL
ncbi:uncharacterized protein A4U43_C01F34240 [Asparagus officinalis]|uniref:Translation initiation factor 3 N-terminal domain-containing protein n=1 Tax=Asparagus officinalis TaxID=4686 RepID=A0A5P1FUB5_ASPOF|nr:uncharacterized protein A4U43_C01F34240 [Asparagus officinalis]